MKMVALEVEGLEGKGRIYRDGDKVVIAVTKNSKAFRKPQIWEFSAAVDEGCELMGIAIQAHKAIDGERGGLASEILFFRSLLDNFIS